MKVSANQSTTRLVRADVGLVSFEGLQVVVLGDHVSEELCQAGSRNLKQTDVKSYTSLCCGTPFMP
jgi:hypothetical protein